MGVNRVAPVQDFAPGVKRVNIHTRAQFSRVSGKRVLGKLVSKLYYSRVLLELVTEFLKVIKYILQ